MSQSRMNPAQPAGAIHGLKLLLGALRAQQWLAHTAHWTASGESFYGVHEMMDRIYKRIADDIDAVAERLVALNPGVNLGEVGRFAQGQAESLLEQGSARDGVKHLVDVIDEIIASCLEAQPRAGLRSFLEGVAEHQDEIEYLLGQTARRNGSTKAGGYPFARKQEQYSFYTKAQLKWAAQDAWNAAQACSTHDPIAEGWYMDDLATIQQELNRRAGRVSRANRGTTSLSRLSRTPRTAADHISAVGGPTNRGSKTPWPIGDLYHARLAVIYAMSPRHAGVRKQVLRAVQRHYPDVDWAAYWEKHRKNQPSWSTIVGAKHNGCGRMAYPNGCGCRPRSNPKKVNSDLVPLGRAEHEAFRRGCKVIDFVDDVRSRRGPVARYWIQDAEGKQFLVDFWEIHDTVYSERVR